MTLTASQRAPIPVLAGSRLMGLADLGDDVHINLERPAVGTAWLLGGLNLNVQVDAVAAGANPAFIVRLGLYLGGQLMDDSYVTGLGNANFWVPGYGIEDSQNPPGMRSIFRQYQPPLPLYDTSDISLRGTLEGFDVTFSRLNIAWRGQVGFL